MSQADITRKQQLDHLAQVRALAHEIESAIVAIGQNDLRQFQSHLAAQDAVCNRLLPAQNLLPVRAENQSHNGDELATEIRDAHLKLAQVNRVYAAVLKRSVRTTGLIASLYRAHAQGYDRNAPVPEKRHTWSCEA